MADTTSGAVGLPGSGVYLEHKHDGELIALIVPMGILAIASVVLRFVARWKTKAAIHGDDVCCLIAFGLWVAYWAVEWKTIRRGLYRVPVQLLPLPMIIEYLHTQYYLPILAVLCITFAKVSILWLYWRLFATRKFRMLCWIVGAYAVAWGIGTTLGCVFRCDPINGAWQILKPHKCYDFLLVFQITEPFNMVSEILCIMIPVNVVRGLQLPLKRKIQLYAIFGLGWFVIIISIVRMVITGTSLAKLASTNSARWLFIQITLSVVVISLPTLGPLASSVELGGKNLMKWYSSMISKRTQSSKSSQTGSSGSDSSPSGSQSKIVVHHEYSLEHKPRTEAEVRNNTRGAAKVYATHYPLSTTHEANEDNMV